MASRLWSREAEIFLKLVREAQEGHWDEARRKVFNSAGGHEVER